MKPDEKMTGDEYIQRAAKFDRDHAQLGKELTDDKEALVLMHASLGLGGEAGELIGALKKRIMYRRQVDRANVVEELGDIFWYLHLVMKQLNITYEEAWANNIGKLEIRFPTGYTHAHAAARLDKVESGETDNG